MLRRSGPMNLMIETNKCLQAHNSLALAVTASHFCCVSDYQQIEEALAFAKSNNLSVMPLGAGSNLVLASDVDGLVVYVDLLGVMVTEAFDTPEGHVDVTFCAGEDWHEMVLYSLKQGWYGLENLSLIPGNMGAAAIQNIGAYGVELSDLLVSLKALDLESGESFTLTNQECQFSYRDSVFKQSLKDKCLITELTLRLLRSPAINLEYPALKGYFLGRQEPLTATMVSEAVCSIRRSKLPDPKELPNVGSFFKNPVIPATKFIELQRKHLDHGADIPGYEQDGGAVKVPAGWLVEHCQFKGVRHGSAGVHKHQALVLVNYNDCPASNNAQDILDLAATIQKKVFADFGIDLEIEPRVYGFI